MTDDGRGAQGEEIKRFVLFAGEDFYPAGGWGDFRGSYDTQEEAESAMQALTLGYLEWFQVVDMQTGKIVLDT